jgi:hypothetical protein
MKIEVIGARGKYTGDLLSAAPDLLEALRSILEHSREFDGLEDHETMLARIQDKARAAIAKATGDAQ